MHLTWSIEKSDDRCPQCDGPTLLIIAPDEWAIDSEDGNGIAYIGEEITGHWCRHCGKLVSLSLNV